MTVSNPLLLIKAGIKARKGFRTWREMRRAKKAIKEFQKEHGSTPVLQEETEMDKQIFKGKLTYTALAVIIASTVAQLFGVDVVEGNVEAIVAGVAAVVGIYGRWRATRQA